MALTNSHILTFPDPNQDYVLNTNILKHSWSGVLIQGRGIQINGKDATSFSPTTYISGTFVGLQMNWVTLTKEAYAIYMAFKNYPTIYMMLESILSVTTHPYGNVLHLTC